MNPMHDPRAISELPRPEKNLVDGDRVYNFDKCMIRKHRRNKDNKVLDNPKILLVAIGLKGDCTKDLSVLLHFVQYS
jgi:hypothetical protein